MTYRFRIAILAIAINTGLCLPSEARADCFKRLTDPIRRDPKADFNDIDAFRAPIPAASGVIKLLDPEDGYGQENVDYYYVTFKRPNDPNKTIDVVFREIRTHIGEFTSGTSRKFSFGPYGFGNHNQEDFQKFQANDKLWKSSNPLGALMHFNLDSLLPTAYARTIREHAGDVSIADMSGDVQVTCSSPTDFIFTTVQTVLGGYHPVSGNRGFGLADNNDGTWTFYSKAADRNTLSIPYATVMIPWINRNVGHPLNVLCNGHSFWMTFYSNMRDYLNQQGMPVVKYSLDNHGPVPYPLNDGNFPSATCWWIW